MRRIAGLLPAALLAAGCSFLIDTDLETGHPCDADRRCLDGFVCGDEGVCIPDTENPSTDPCGGACGEFERCDRETRTCRDICDGAICGTGEVCLRTAGGCTPIVGGVGQICQTDDDCDGLVAGCSPGGAGDARVHCACMVPATMAFETQPQGVCLGIPADGDDCAACGDALCLRTVFSSAGPAGVPGERAVCVPEGFADCRDGADCIDSDAPTVCTYLGWPNDPAARGYPEGLFSACLTPAWDADKTLGDGCDPEDPLACDTGLCVSVGQGNHGCTAPCDDDLACHGAVDRCLEAPVQFGRRGGDDARPLLWDVARICGHGPSLGDVCEPLQAELSSCATDAPLCEESPLVAGERCTRPCRKDADCGDDPGFTCPVGSDVCLQTG
jgi:hypothetical protein